MTIAKKLIAYPVVGLMLLAGLASSAQAVDLTTGLTDVGSEAGIETSRTLEQTIGSIIQVILGFLGIIFLILVIYAGFLWMTAGGNSDKVDKAKSILVQATIGLVVILAAYAITEFVIGGIGSATGTGT